MPEEEATANQMSSKIEEPKTGIRKVSIISESGSKSSKFEEVDTQQNNNDEIDPMSEAQLPTSERGSWGNHIEYFLSSFHSGHC